jgi:Arm DNA-binding domain
MARQRQEDRRELTHFVLNSLKGRLGSRYLVWDTKAYHMAVAVYPSGTQVFYFIYSKNGRKHWHKIDKAGLADARAEAARLEHDLKDGRNPQAERAAVKDVDTFVKVYGRYLEEKLKPNNKSWQHTDYLVRSHVLPRWGTREVSTIVRKDALALHSFLSKDRPILARRHGDRRGRVARPVADAATRRSRAGGDGEHA